MAKCGCCEWFREPFVGRRTNFGMFLSAADDILCDQLWWYIVWRDHPWLLHLVRETNCGGSSVV